MTNLYLLMIVYSYLKSILKFLVLNLYFIVITWELKLLNYISL